MNKAEILELASADRLSAFCDQWERGRHNGDEIHCIGNGAGVEICLTVTDIRGQSLQMVEYYARQRSQRKLGQAAMLKWEGTK